MIFISKSLYKNQLFYYKFLMKKNIFILEDDEAQREILKKSLSDEAHSVILPSSVSEALDYLVKTEEKIDLFISDILLPDLGGLEFRKYTLSSKRYQDVPFIFLTGHLRYTQDALQLSPHLILTKPIMGDDVKKIVANLFLELVS
jgi:two-component SAPR family response regulator